MDMKEMQTAPQIEGHAAQRLAQRLNGLITPAEVQKAIDAAQKYSSGKVYFQVKKFSQLVHLEDAENNDINGDAVVAVIKSGRIATFMLTKSWRKNYFADGRYIQ